MYAQLAALVVLVPTAGPAATKWHAWASLVRVQHHFLVGGASLELYSWVSSERLREY